MSAEEFKKANAGLDQSKIVAAPKTDKPAGPFNKDAKLDCGLVYDHEEGGYAVMRATVYVTITVDQVRGGRYVGSIDITMSPGDTLALMQNLDGQNYDGFRC